MSFMPSQSYVARALYNIGADREWGEATTEEQAAHMNMARVVIAAIQSWQAQHRPAERSDRYTFGPISDHDGPYAMWGIYDRIAGLAEPLGSVRDPLLAQQIVDDLNKRDVKKEMRQTLNELAEK